MKQISESWESWDQVEKEKKFVFVFAWGLEIEKEKNLTADISRIGMLNIMERYKVFPIRNHA